MSAAVQKHDVIDSIQSMPNHEIRYPDSEAIPSTPPVVVLSSQKCSVSQIPSAPLSHEGTVPTPSFVYTRPPLNTSTTSAPADAYCIEATSSAIKHTAGADRGFDPFRAVQDRLREKMRTLELQRQNAHRPQLYHRPPSPIVAHIVERVLEESPSPCRPAAATYSEVCGVSSEEKESPDAEPPYRSLSQDTTIRLTDQKDVVGFTMAALPTQRGHSTLIKPGKEPVLVGDGRTTTRTRTTSKSKRGGSTGLQRIQRSPYCVSAPKTRTSSITSGSRQPKNNAGSARSSLSSQSVSRQRNLPASAEMPKPMWVDATVLEHLTGAELFAVLRMRGLVTSCGDTQEYRLPPTQCHRLYLTPYESEQLADLRAALGRRSQTRKT